MKCQKCGFENPKEMKFCGQCGSKLGNVCPECGAENPPEFKFCGKCGTKITESPIEKPEIHIPKLESMQDRIYIPEPLRRKMTLAEQELQGENRLVTALFADISGFTPLSNQHSPEKVVNIVNDCFKIIVDTIFKYEGNPNRFIGDNVLAFFGAPIAHENDPERAIMSALEMRDKVKDLSLDISIGINTGLMYFGPIGTQEHLEISAYGPDINLAKRLQEIAKPGQILVGSGTYKFTRKAFDFTQLPDLSIKGIDRPITAYEAIRIKEHPEKLRGIEGLRSRMIGRENEFAELIEAVDKWLSGEGQMVSIIGEAGIGKSRLVAELRAYINQIPLRGDLITCLEGRCISIGQPIAYWPVIDMFRTLFDLKGDDTEKEVAKKVRDGITELFPSRADDILPFIGHLMSIKLGDELDKRLEGWSSEQISYQTMVRLRDIFTTIARNKPLLLIFEDLHWSDDLSLDLISMLMDELVTSQLMILCVYRPEQEHKCWRLNSIAQRKCFENYIELQLKKLSRRQSYEMVQSLLAIDDLPDSVRDMILAKSEGNPFFIEEVIRSLIDRGLVYKVGDRWTARSEIEHIDVPDTIQGVIMERIDKLEAEVRYVLQCASVIGRLFKYRLLSHIASQERRLNEYLDELEGKELILEEKVIPELEYSFKHVLTQEATYQTILEQRRRQFHRQVAEGIERLYRDRIEEFYEELAHHWEESGDKERTLEYLLKAGEKASKNYLNEVTIEYYTKAIELAKVLGIKDDRLGDLYYQRALIYSIQSLYEECISDFLESIKFYSQRNKRARSFSSLAVIFAWHMSDYEEAQYYLKKMLDEIDPNDRSYEAVSLFGDSGYTLACLGLLEPEEAEKLTLNAIEIAEEKGYKDTLGNFYTLLDHLYYYIFRFDRNHEKYKKAHEKALYYIPYSSLVDYAGNCQILAHTSEGDERIYLFHEASSAGLKSGNVWAIVLSSMRLGEYYRSIDIDKALEFYEIGWDTGVKVRWIFGNWFIHIAHSLIEIYAQRGERSKLLKMMEQIIDVTFELHGKAKVHPTVQKRWNDTVEQIYQKLHDSDIDVYYEYERKLNDYLHNANDDRERFFYLGQLILLATFAGKKDVLETYVKEINTLEHSSGSYSERVALTTKYIIELLNTDQENRIEISGNFINSVDNKDIDELSRIMKIINQVLTDDQIDQVHNRSIGIIKNILGQQDNVWDLIRFIQDSCPLLSDDMFSRIFGLLSHQIVQILKDLDLLSTFMLYIINIQNAFIGSKRSEFFLKLLVNLYENTKLKDISSNIDQISAIEPENIDDFLHWIEFIYVNFGHQDAFYQICDRLKEVNPKNIQDIGLVQLYPRRTNLPVINANLELFDNFDSISSDWEWVDPKGDCFCELDKDGKGLIISVPDGHDFWSDGISGNHDAPRLLREITGDFIIETKISRGTKGKMSGGLLVIKDTKSHLRFELPSSSIWDGEIRFERHYNNDYNLIGRGFLDADQLILYMIRQNNKFSTYCSKDGIEWFECGYLDFFMPDPIKVGIIALCPNENSPMTSTRFEYFKIYRAK